MSLCIRIFIRWVQWQTHGEGGTFPLLVGDCDGATVLFDDLVRTRQAKAASFDLPGYIRGAMEAIEDMGKIVVGNANPLILNAQHGPLIAFFRHLHSDDAAFRAVLDGVG